MERADRYRGYRVEDLVLLLFMLLPDASSPAVQLPVGAHICFLSSAAVAELVVVAVVVVVVGVVVIFVVF